MSEVLFSTIWMIRKLLRSFSIL